VGRLCGAEERVLERVVTYLVSAVERGRNMKRHLDCSLFRRKQYERAGRATIALLMVIFGQWHTNVVLPAPWTPLRPTKKGVGSSPFEAYDSRCFVILSRMKGTQCSDLSSMISGILSIGG
jgi:hypothetical protein